MLCPELKLELTKVGRREARGDKIIPRKRSVENQKSLAPSKYLQMSTLCLTKVMIILIVISHSLKLNVSFELGSKGQINQASLLFFIAQMQRPKWKLLD
jgi:hypothetical protein